jgi:sugar phosphate isomerase/epimerase
MAVEFYKALWGMEGDLADVLAAVRDAGYDGIEAPIGQLQPVREIGDDIPVIAMSFPLDLQTFQTDLEATAKLGARKLTVHAGKDWWSFAEGAAFFAAALKAAEGAPFEVNYETHRGRLLFEPVSTVAYLTEFPTLTLCADFSHWTCVCESLLHDQEDRLALAISRVGHLHARIGHEEGPQVPDPRVPAWAGHTNRFFEIWDRVHQRFLAEGRTLTVDPEFGPPHYLWTNPATGAPLADLFAYL